MKISILCLFMLLWVGSTQAQTDSLKTDSTHRRNWPILGFIPMKNVNIHGVAVGPWSPMRGCNTTINGITIELIGVGLIMPAGLPYLPFEELHDEKLSEGYIDTLFKHPPDSMQTPASLAGCTHNGIVVSPGGTLTGTVNGINLSGFSSWSERTNGITTGLTVLINEDVRGIALAGMFNIAGNVEGLQIGLYNKTARLRGFQIGLWNVNRKRSLPFINWDF